MYTQLLGKIKGRNHIAVGVADYMREIPPTILDKAYYKDGQVSNAQASAMEKERLERIEEEMAFSDKEGRSQVMPGTGYRTSATVDSLEMECRFGRLMQRVQQEAPRDQGRGFQHRQQAKTQLITQLTPLQLPVRTPVLLAKMPGTSEFTAMLSNNHIPVMKNLFLEIAGDNKKMISRSGAQGAGDAVLEDFNTVQRTQSVAFVPKFQGSALKEMGNVRYEYESSDRHASIDSPTATAMGEERRSMQYGEEQDETMMRASSYTTSTANKKDDPFAMPTPSDFSTAAKPMTEGEVSWEKQMSSGAEVKQAMELFNEPRGFKGKLVRTLAKEKVKNMNQILHVPHFAATSAFNTEADSHRQQPVDVRLDFATEAATPVTTKVTKEEPLFVRFGRPGEASSYLQTFIRHKWRCSVPLLDVPNHVLGEELPSSWTPREPEFRVDLTCVRETVKSVDGIPFNLEIPTLDALWKSGSQKVGSGTEVVANRAIKYELEVEVLKPILGKRARSGSDFDPARVLEEQVEQAKRLEAVIFWLTSKLSL